MNIKSNIQSGTVVVFAGIVYVFAALPVDDSAIAFSQGRVWVVTLALLTTLALAIVSGKLLPFLYQTLRKRLNIMLLCWWAMILVSGILAPMPVKALLGSEWGQMGVLQLGLCIAVFYICQNIALTEREWYILSIGMIVLVLLAALEAVGLRPLFWLPESTAYPSVTIGQRGHLAGLFALAAGVAAYKRTYPTLFLALIGISLCNNTSALLAFIGVCGLALSFDRRCTWKPLVAILVLSLPIFVITPSIIFIASLESGKNIQTKQFVISDAPSLGIRLKFWRSSWSMFLDRPLLGWGDEQYQENWITYMPAEEQMPMILKILGFPKDAHIDGNFPNYFYIGKDGMVLKSVVNIHPHNYYIEELQNHGLIGFILIFSSIVLLISGDRRITIALSGYGIYLLAWFLVFSVLPIFAMILGLLVADHRDSLLKKN